MDYLTNYYRNLSEQLQQRVNFLQKLVEQNLTAQQKEFEASALDPGEGVRPTPPVVLKAKQAEIEKKQKQKEREEHEGPATKEAHNVVASGAGVGTAGAIAGGAMGLLSGEAAAAAGTIGTAVAAAPVEAALAVPLVATALGYGISRGTGLDKAIAKGVLGADFKPSSAPSTKEEMKSTADAIRARQLELYGKAL